jgi:arabinofuranosyltransferase
MTSTTAAAAEPIQARPSTAARTAWLPALVTVLLASALAWVLTGRPPAVGIDDANISMVFSSNLAHGHGYVFFPGQERVEGSTSLLWTLLVALLFRVTEHPEPAILLLGFVLTAISVYFLDLLFDRLILGFSEGRARRSLRLAYAVYLVTCVPVAFWGVLSMMDTSLWLTLTSLFVWLVLSSNEGEASPSYANLAVWAGLGLVAAVARPEAPALLGAGAVASVLTRGGSPRDTWSWHREGALVVGLALGTAAVTVFRLAYFGVPVPNTFYAKVSSHSFDNVVSGARYIAYFVLSDSLASLFLIAAAWVLLRLVRARVRGEGARAEYATDTQWPQVGFLSFWILLVIALQLLLGGDHFAHFRFFLPILPLLPIPLLFLLQHRTSWLSPDRARAIVLVACCVGARQAYFYGKQQPIRGEFQIALDGRRLGDALNQSFASLPSMPTVGSVRVGGLARRYEGRVLDLMGLCWVEMGRSGDRRRVGVRNHAAFSETVFYRSPPDIVLARLARPGQAFVLEPFDVAALKNIPLSERFRSLFLPCETPAGKGDRMMFLARRDWIGANADPAIHCGGWEQVSLSAD